MFRSQITIIRELPHHTHTHTHTYIYNENKTVITKYKYGKNMRYTNSLLLQAKFGT